MRLDLGSGVYPEGGYTTVDAHADADVHAGLDDLPFEDGTVTEIRCAHALEHLGRADGYRAVGEMWRVLESGGQACISVPDFDALCREWALTGNLRLLPFFYGGQQNDGEYHKWGYTEDSLRRLLEGFGFVVQVGGGFDSVHRCQTIWAIARKP